MYPKTPATLIQKNTSTPMFIATLFIIAKIWKQPQCPPVDEWIKQLWSIYTMEYYSAVKKRKHIFTFATARIDLKNIMLSEISKSEKDKLKSIHLLSFRKTLLKYIKTKCQLYLWICLFFECDTTTPHLFINFYFYFIILSWSIGINPVIYHLICKYIQEHWVEQTQ